MTKSSLKYRLINIRKRALAASEQPIPESVQAYLTGAVVARPQTDVQSDGDERRRFTRIETESELTMRRIGGFNFLVALSNLSAGGCKVELVEPAETGDSAIARFPQLEPLGSRICWTSGRTTGVEFATPMHPAVFDSLVSRLPERKVRPHTQAV